MSRWGSARAGKAAVRISGEEETVYAAGRSALVESQSLLLEVFAFRMSFVVPLAMFEVVALWSIAASPTSRVNGLVVALLVTPPIVWLVRQRGSVLLAPDRLEFRRPGLREPLVVPRSTISRVVADSLRFVHQPYPPVPIVDLSPSPARSSNCGIVLRDGTELGPAVAGFRFDSVRWRDRGAWREDGCPTRALTFRVRPDDIRLLQAWAE